MCQGLLSRLRVLCFAVAAGLFPPLVGAAPNSFHATIFFSEEVAPPTDSTAPCFLVGEIFGTGVASKLGGTHLQSRDCINPLPPTFTSYAFSSSQVVLKGSNGDEIWATYSGILSAEGAITGTYVVYGGTGRYSNATGAGTINGFETIDLATGAGRGQLKLEGTLSF